MLAVEYAVVRFITDPVRDEPINIGIIISAPAGAAFISPPLTGERMMAVDPYLDIEAAEEILAFLAALAARPALRVQPDRIEVVEPGMAGFLPLLAGQLPRRCELGRVLRLAVDGNSDEDTRQALSDLVDGLVAPPTTERQIHQLPAAG